MYENFRWIILDRRLDLSDGILHVVYSIFPSLSNKNNNRTVYSTNYISNAFLCNTRLLAVHYAIGALDKREVLTQKCEKHSDIFPIRHESKTLSLLLAVPEYGVGVHADF